MQAKETKLQDIIEGTKQYVIPLFQRTYSWTNKEWEIFWKDLVDLCEAENPRTHFIGSIVNMPTVSVPEGVAKYLLIDGQQRLTTVFILLTLLRNKAREAQDNEFAEEINNTLLVNPYKKDNDFFKLMPTQADRETYMDFILSRPIKMENQISRGYTFFEKKLKQLPLSPEVLKKIITTYFSVVSIVLDVDDNPYLVFESLNAKGRPLTQADLIRNYFFMRIHVDKQDEVYSKYWQPMQVALGEDLTEYIRHFLTRNGKIIKQSDVYYALKESVNLKNVVDYLKELRTFSTFYQRLIYPQFEPDIELQRHFRRLNRIEVTTAYPLLLSFYYDYETKKLSKDEFITILKTLENFLIRRFVCGIPTNQLNKIFLAVHNQIREECAEGSIVCFRNILQQRGYPKDSEFYSRFKNSKFYGGGDRLIKTKLILETFEDAFAHKEAVSFENLTVEHVMPQKITEWWKTHLGSEWEETHELFLHTIGNLTLTAYNAEMSNDDFTAKKKTYTESHLELNGYFSQLDVWTRTSIEQRSDYLAKTALEIWNYFGQEKSPHPQTVTGTTPSALVILGQKFAVKSWRDVLEQTLNTVAELEPEKFEIIAKNFPCHVGKEKSKFREIRQLQNGYFVEVNLSAQSIQKLCCQAMETIELNSEWDVSAT